MSFERKCPTFHRTFCLCFLCFHIHSGFVRHFLTSFFVEPPLGPSSALHSPGASQAFTSCAFVFSRALSGFWSRDMQDVFLGMAGAEPERATRIDSISIARAQLCCQANSGAISYRQEKILQVTPRISCRQEFHFWNGRRRDNVPEAPSIPSPEPASSPAPEVREGRYTSKCPAWRYPRRLLNPGRPGRSNRARV